MGSPPLQKLRRVMALCDVLRKSPDGCRFDDIHQTMAEQYNEEATARTLYRDLEALTKARIIESTGDASWRWLGRKPFISREVAA